MDSVRLQKGLSFASLHAVQRLDSSNCSTYFDFCTELPVAVLKKRNSAFVCPVAHVQVQEEYVCCMIACRAANSLASANFRQLLCLHSASACFLSLCDACAYITSSRLSQVSFSLQCRLYAITLTACFCLTVS